MEYFSGRSNIQVVLVVSNKPTAPVLKVAGRKGIATHVVDRPGFYGSEELLEVLEAHRITFVVLAGFLWLVPAYLVAAFPKRMVNIHPALLPKFGGKGMYGMHVHRAVKTARETETGITIHLVDEAYDEGSILFQARCPVLPEDTPEAISEKVRRLEHEHFAPVINKYLEAFNS